MARGHVKFKEKVKNLQQKVKNIFMNYLIDDGGGEKNGPIGGQRFAN